MEGAEAEIELLGNCEGCDGGDRIEILNVQGQFRFSGYEARLRKMTRMLVRRHRVPIERVPDALLAETTLSGPNLDKLGVSATASMSTRKLSQRTSAERVGVKGFSRRRRCEHSEHP
jgi:hypothetical protein